MNYSRFDIQDSITISRDPRCFIPQSAIRNPQSGFTYIALLAAIVIIGISMGAAGKYWSFMMQREKEEELLFRGEQYRLAIERYVNAIPGRNQYPPSIDDLLKDGRSAQGKRHLRQQYKDPMTGEDFEIIRDLTKGNRITGVYSKSEKQPLKNTGFPEQYQSFEGKNSYKEWQFIFSPQQFPTGGQLNTGQSGTKIPPPQ